MSITKIMIGIKYEKWPVPSSPVRDMLDTGRYVAVLPRSVMKTDVHYPGDNWHGNDCQAEQDHDETARLLPQRSPDGEHWHLQVSADGLVQALRATESGIRDGLETGRHASSLTSLHVGGQGDGGATHMYLQLQPPRDVWI
jgi:hypothetical protein